MTKLESTKKVIPGILILSHGPMCKAVIESAQMIAGDMEGVVAVPFESGMNPEDYINKVKKAFGTMPEGSVVLFDLLGGTPFNQAVVEYRNSGLEGVCGMNLPMLLEALSLRENLSGHELAEALTDCGRTGIVNVGEFIHGLLQDCV